MEYYEDEADFYELFEEDTFDVEETVDGVFKGYIIAEGKKLLAATFDTTNNMGWYDDTLI